MPAATLRPRADDEDRWFDLAGLAAHTGLSVKTLRRYMDDPVRPLPYHHIHTSSTDRGRILISKREFDAWVAQFPPRPKVTAEQEARMAAALKSTTRAMHARVAAAVKSIRGEDA